MTSIHKLARTMPMDLLYVNATDIGVLNDYIFEGLYIENIQVRVYEKRHGHWGAE